MVDFKRASKTYIINNLAYSNFKMGTRTIISALQKVSQSLTTLQFASTHTHTTSRTQLVISYGLRSLWKRNGCTASRLKINHIFSLRYPHHLLFSCCSFSCALSRAGSKNYKRVLSLWLLFFYHFHYHSKTCRSHWWSVNPVWALSSVSATLIS